MILPSPLLLATRNPGKLREIVAILGGGAPAVVRSLCDHPDYVPAPETQPDYLGNARIKARDAATSLSLPSLADDSGIEVDALGGGPGPRSARFAGDECDDDANNELLLRELRGSEVRTARYRCLVVLAWPDGREAWAEGVCEGSIGYEPRGLGGFGYDPYFVLPDGRTMAEIPAEEKNRISHRAAALQALLADVGVAVPRGLK
jgi:XTP/dITP diphosphohydrolase